MSHCETRAHPRTLNSRQVNQAIASIVTAIAPGTTLVLTGDFAHSIQDNFDSRGIPVTYGMDRGANKVSAKTMRNIEGNSTIYFPDWFVFGFEDETADNTIYRTAYVLHAAAQETAHALHRTRTEDSEAAFDALCESRARQTSTTRKSREL